MAAARKTPSAARRPLTATAREPLRFLWRCLDKYFGDGCSTMAAALSFYTFFSLPALLSLLLMIVGTAMDASDVQRAILTETTDLIGRAGAEQIRTIIEHARQVDVNKPTAAILSLLAVAIGATASFGQLQAALNTIWGVKPDPKRGQIRNFLAKRIFSFGVVIGVAFLLLVSLAFSAILSALGQRLTRNLGIPEAVLQFTDWAISFAALSGVFAAMYHFLPDARIAWTDVWVGGVASALLFVIGKSVIGYYLGDSDPGSAYGAAGSLAVVLIWVYYTSMVVLFGAVVTRVWAERYGGGVRPERGAVEVIEVEREVQRG
ncbi:MAG: YihY/virulence factor BrkB family protein [Gemmatimonadota bacterium]|nr:YihY/virulence factor BrkB family protein [Gemmatimonadota bacterium]